MSNVSISSADRDGDLVCHGEVPGSYVRLLYDYLRQQGSTPEKVLQRAEPAMQHVEPVGVVEWRDLLLRAQTHLSDPLLALHLGQHATPAHFGVMGYLLLACEHLAAALQRMEAYNRLLYDVNPLKVRLDGERMVLEWAMERGRPGALVDETAITALICIARNITGLPLTPAQVEFVNGPPLQLEAYEAFFGCPVLFGQIKTRVVLPVRMLQSPLRQPDAALLGLLEAQAERLLAELPASDVLESNVRRAVARLAPEGEHALDTVARVLNMSPRTLHRRLEDRGLNFRSLRDDVLCRLAQDHLSDPHLQLADVAQLLGYSEQSAFNRAFKRWTGRTPRQCRHDAA